MKNRFYQAVSIQDTDSGQNFASLFFVRENEIFKVHFPDSPILPGTCLVQISKEFLEEHLHQRIQISCFNDLKFLKKITPDEFIEIIICFSSIKNEDNYSASITYSKDDHLFCKLNYLFVMIS
jgi:3-hydroxyacyl-[acyl-carrier-protein] dehydratase